MKNQLYLIILIVCAAAISAFSQSTEIRPGTVLPQMTTAQRTALASPVNGTLVFDSTTQSYWFRQSGVWVELPKGGSTANYWQLSGLGGNELTNTNSGGFWSANPTGLTNSSSDVTNPPTAPVNGDGTRLMWLPNRSAFRVGTVADNAKSWDADNIGLFSFASGYNTKAIDKYATAMGNQTIASGGISTAMGSATTASGGNSTAMGYETIASGFSSIAMGGFTNASANYSTAMGTETKALGDYSTAMGYRTTASGSTSTAMGYKTESLGQFSTAMGYEAKASGLYSTAMGGFTKALANYSTALGYYTVASGSYSTAMGVRVSTGNKQGSFVIGDYISETAALGGDTLYATAANQFSARFNNGYRFYTDNDLSAATKYGVSMSNKDNAWSSLSDSTKKERFLSYDPQRVLNSVAAMRVGTWNYKGDDRPQGRHWGVMAQDFYRHFGSDEYGTIGCDTLIATADFDGVSFAAIKALELRTRELQQENERLRKEVALKEEKYLQLFAELKAEITASKSDRLTLKTKD